MRVIALVTLLTLAIVSAWSVPHRHLTSTDRDGTACSACTFRSNPLELSEAPPTSPSLFLAIEEQSAAAVTAPFTGRCLTRAPKQGPPAT